MKAAGPVFTVRGRPDPTIDKHSPCTNGPGCSRVRRAAMSSYATTGRHAGAVWRPLSRGAGDQGFAWLHRRWWVPRRAGGRRPGFPVFARFRTPIDIVCAWRAEAFGEPIAIGGLQVLPDDHVLADRDGIILIGAADVAEVIDAAERKMATEGDMARAIRAGEDPQAAYLRFRVF